MVRPEKIFDNDDELYDDFEDWEGDSYYLGKKDYSGLLKYRSNMLNEGPMICMRRLDLEKRTTWSVTTKLRLIFSLNFTDATQIYQTFST